MQNVSLSFEFKFNYNFLELSRSIKIRFFYEVDRIKIIASRKKQIFMHKITICYFSK